MNFSRLRLVTFDVTGTLLKLRAAPGQQYGEVGAMYGVVADNNALITNFKEQFRRLSAEHPNFGLRTGLGWQNWWNRVVKNTFAASKIEFDDAKLDAVARHLLEMYETTACWQHCDGVPAILSFLRNRGLRVGVVSNFDPRLDTILRNNKLRHYFDFVLGSYEFGAEKPDATIFRKAMEEAGGSVAADECLHIGNNAKMDYFGATRSGWQSALVSDVDVRALKQKYPELDENHVFSSLYQLHKRLLEAIGDKLPTSDAD
ncbi:rhythmically expressed gene 2 protein-like [Cylas formicarius]|uniref:rhythmically expressed gene 2 protein-like n=1 Tax=Cylas formicarius TaxID=197179 RepID=UPI0029588CAB|nr:rhythmically expressed gene 2 protein-like [Cylas formicarius]